MTDAVLEIDAAVPPDWYGVNCAHPLHVLPALGESGDLASDRQDRSWAARVAAFRPNASTLSHAELDAMTVLDTGDLALLNASTERVRQRLPGLRVVGGCCGTDAGHVGALWGTDSPAH